MATSDQPASAAARHSFRDVVLASGLVRPADFDAVAAQVREASGAAAPHNAAFRAEERRAVAELLVSGGLLTAFQAQELLAGRSRFRLGQYTVLDKVGRGGMGHVFKAEHSMMGRQVAVKVLPRSKATPESEAAFQREMRILGRLDHPNLVRAFDAGYDAMVYYLVTELVAGLDLKRQVHRHGPLDEVTAASVFSQAARGLAHAHDLGVVHRDVKPGNIIVMDDGQAKVLDMGLAGSMLDEESVLPGRVVGTMDYIAPEQTLTPDAVGPAADVYGLGCTLYFALSGEVPFPGGTAKEKIKRHRSEAPRPLRALAPHVSEAMCRVVEAMMEKLPEKRVSQARDVVQLLARWVPDHPVPPSRRVLPRGRRGSAHAAGEGSGSGSATGDTPDGPGSEPAPPQFPVSADSWAGGRGTGPAEHGTGAGSGFFSSVGNAATSERGWHAAAAAVGMLVPAATVGIVFGWGMAIVRDIAPALFDDALGDWTPAFFGKCGFVAALVLQFLAARSASRGETTPR